MSRTTVYLDEATILDLRQLADMQKRTQAEIIRDALAKYINQVKPTKAGDCWDRRLPKRTQRYIG